MQFETYNFKLHIFLYYFMQEAKLIKALKAMPVVALLGSRQVGKTTLAIDIAHQYLKKSHLPRSSGAKQHRQRATHYPTITGSVAGIVAFRIAIFWASFSATSINAPVTNSWSSIVTGRPSSPPSRIF